MADYRKQGQITAPDGRLYELIKAISQHNVRDPRTGAIYGTERITGYVVKIHKDGEHAGTVDVQEYGDLEDDESLGVGLHEGVYLSAIQHNNGVLVIPKLYSDVVIVRDTGTQREYVAMFSHVDVIRLDAYDTVSVGVTERKDFDLEDEGAPDVNDLELTGVKAVTEYKKDSITTTLQADTEGNQSYTETISGGGAERNVQGGKTVEHLKAEGYDVNHNGGTVKITDDHVEASKGSSKVKVTDSVVYVGADSVTDDAVLGQQLASILSKLAGCLSKMMTPTMMGPQPPANVLGEFISLQTEIQSFAASHSGFLTNKVQIRK